MTSKFLRMGRLLRPHGIKGEIILEWYALSPFVCDCPYFVQKGAETPLSITIIAARTHHAKLLVSIKGIEDRTSAECMQGKYILVERQNLPCPEPNEAYICDLIGCSVYIADGTKIGHFSHVVAGTNTAVWSITTEEDTEILFPAQPEFIISLDPEHDKIVINPPAGLLELYTNLNDARTS